jgi:hypothetical protein
MSDLTYDKEFWLRDPGLFSPREKDYWIEMCIKESTDKSRTITHSVHGQVMDIAASKMCEHPCLMVDYTLSILGAISTKKYALPSWGSLCNPTEDDKILYQKGNTPTNRWILLQFLEAFRDTPMSWGKSAMTRFFRGIGKQADSTYSGAGILSAERGWLEVHVKYMVELYMDGSPMGYIPGFGKCIITDTLELDRETVEAMVEQSGDYSTTFRATQNRKNKPLLNAMIAYLDTLGEKEAPIIAVKEVKIRKIKTFKVGDKITSTSIKDLPVGSIVDVELSAITSAIRGTYTREMLGKKTTMRVVYEGLDPEDNKICYIRPMTGDVAFGKVKVARIGFYEGKRVLSGWVPYYYGNKEDLGNYNTGSCEVSSTYVGTYSGTPMSINPTWESYFRALCEDGKQKNITYIATQDTYPYKYVVKN